MSHLVLWPRVRVVAPPGLWSSARGPVSPRGPHPLPGAHLPDHRVTVKRAQVWPTFRRRLNPNPKVPPLTQGDRPGINAPRPGYGPLPRGTAAPPAAEAPVHRRGVSNWAEGTLPVRNAEAPPRSLSLRRRRPGRSCHVIDEPPEGGSGALRGLGRGGRPGRRDGGDFGAALGGHVSGAGT